MIAPRPRHGPLTLVTLALTLTACTSGGTEKDGAEPGTGSGTHTVKTAMGDVKVKDHPKRVVVLDTAELDSAITLGVTPVGATRAGAEDAFLSYLPKEKTDGITEVGEIANPGLEKIAALKPDLILSNKVRDGQRYQQLSAIAPTVLTETTGYPWKQNFLVHADALGRKAQARAAVKTYEKRVAAVTEALGGKEKAAGVDVNVVRFVEGADIRIYGKKNYIGTILAEVGIGRPAITDKAKDGFTYDVSPEQIDKADADVIFTSTYGSPNKAKVTETTTSGLWRKLKAVRDGKVFQVDDELWIQGIGYTAAGRILGELQSDLAT
ncbi:MULTISPECIES: iron-siderophore ABC transporter substrate-binding protein [unclassified Streptomyces]|uniref:ABC transporter substrate-binding protein n=1 Tax=unclassified Streptomyces TaxID=2593676 RepID=UPI000DBA0928|nr:iron-siderophore ABC transporter substrate-binding protein [Streptomyces sp. PsTaAH-137]MYT72186.1 ABC transporter substrate-binding protein [Streptomyces sp. SID8367]RAJ81597.1 iron complex transport system substrate-binding protein [Streptomyces sp. PsTaAH-137]